MDTRKQSKDETLIHVPEYASNDDLLPAHHVLRGEFGPMVSVDFTHGHEDHECQCDNCGWTGFVKDGIAEITDFHERVDPGCPVPVCDCPSCGALCYLTNVAGWQREDSQ